MIQIFEVKAKAYIKINFAMHFFDKQIFNAMNLYTFVVFNLFNFYDTKIAKEYLNSKKLFLRRA